MLRRILLLIFCISLAEACHPQFEKELRYLDLYLGIKPDNDGEIPQKEEVEFASYVEDSQDLNCDFNSDCLWRNAPSDSMLDTSEFWFFKKTSKEHFPVQIQPGNAEPPVGTRFVVAGNTSTHSESAVLLSAPVACQRGPGHLQFDYWLYNQAKVEVVIVKSVLRRGHLMVITRPQMNCHFLRPTYDVCNVTVPQINEPFRIGIRAFNLKDNTVGSMVLLNNITYTASTCRESPFPSMFSSIPLNPRPHAHVSTLSDIECVDPMQRCRWRNAISTASEWRIGRESGEKWNEVMEVSSHSVRPKDSFLFLVVDELTPKPFATLQSDLIPCTSRMATLSFRYWMRPGTQVEICSVDEEGVPLSCAYLSEDDGPGPIEIDVEAYSRPFRFTVDVITFDSNSMGVVAIEGLKFTGGLLCTEQPPLAVTTVDPPTDASTNVRVCSNTQTFHVSQMFGLQPKPFANAHKYSLTLACDFSTDHCNQWVNDDGKLQYGVAPEDSDEFPIPKEIKGNVALLLLKGKDASTIRSREVPCAYNAVITITYMRSEFGYLRVCAKGQCIEGEQRHGTIVVEISSMDAFELTIEASSSKNAMIIISEIEVEGDLCPLRTVEQILCDRIKCDFKGGMCQYESVVEKPGDVRSTLTSAGITAVISEGKTRSILQSPIFDLPAPALLAISVTQYTFGSRVLLCPNVDTDFDSCHELLGPKVMSPTPRRIQFPLDSSAHQFAIVFFHDKAAQFGPAKFEIESIDILTSDDYQLCF